MKTAHLLLRALGRARHAALASVAALGLSSAAVAADRGTDAAALERLASQYAAFDAALNEAARSDLDTPSEVRRVLKNLRYKKADGIAKGWYAYRALIAARHDDFVRGVNEEVGVNGKHAVLRQLTGSGSYARNIPGAQSAAAAVIDAIAADNRKMADLSARFMTAAREFQNTKWGALEPLTAPGDAARDMADTGKPVSEMLAELGGALNRIAGITPAQAYSPSTMERILALGARRVIGEAHGMTLDHTAVLIDKQNSKCLRWARLNLNQCLAAAHFPSEEAWCTGKHAIEDVRACWAKVLPPKFAGLAPARR